MFGRALAWIKVEPAATPVTGTFTLVAPAANVTLAGTVATPVLPELRLMLTPLAGAGAERFRETYRLVVPVIVKVAGKKLSVAVT
jgi:FlaG/FlaF family flagellin (archaellin)